MRSRKNTELLGMRQIKEILRLHYLLGLNQSEISRSVGVSRATVQDYLRRAEANRFDKSKIESSSEEELLLVLKKEQRRGNDKPEPNHTYIQQELCKRGVTLALLWQEYIQEFPHGHSYSGFCIYYGRWKKSQRLSMRQNHKAGEKLFVDFSGQRVPIYNRETNLVSYQAEIFVSVLGASNYTYIEAVETQSLEHWLGVHSRAFSYYGGVPEVVVPDNLKSGVKKAYFYDPEINPSYCDFAEHYAIAIIPARVKKPKDKSKVEVGVQVIERWILAAVRNRRFYSIPELNAALRPFLEKVNNKLMKSYGCSRKELFEKIEKKALKPLPQQAYQFFNTKLARVNIDYHVELDKHYYSVPYQLIGQEVEIRIREQTIEVIHSGKRVAMHLRSNEKYKHTTDKSHMPVCHQSMLEWTPSRFISWGAKIGSETKTQVEKLLNSKLHPEQSYRACLGLLRLSKKVGDTRLEAACKRANHLSIVSMRRVKSILDAGMDKLPLFENNTQEIERIIHTNIRGRNYYH